uniref:Dual specificity protein phosphatase n=1 Tax=Eptatretus burgeri TaxID=7764 RepID=A0A8C4X051_EPTBU
MVVMETCDGSRRALTLLGALECDSLHALLRESNENGERCREHDRDSAVLGRCLLLDCRSFLAFSSSHIRGSLNVHSNPILLRRRVRRHHGPGPGLLPLSQLVPSADARARLQAGLYSALVLLDERSRDVGTLRPDCTLAIAAASLVGQSHGIPVYLLKGGYELFCQEFPELCINSSSNLSTTCKASTRLTTTGKGEQGGPVEILPFLYLGNAMHAARREALDSLGITALLNVSSDLPNHFEGLFTYKSIPVEDNQKADIGAWFLEAIDFIDSVRQSGGRVFVHCHAGISRSATICLAYLMKTQSLRLDEAFDYIRERRSVISPNFNFLGQLQSFEAQILSPDSSRSQPEVLPPTDIPTE